MVNSQNISKALRTGLALFACCFALIVPAISAKDASKADRLDTDPRIVSGTLDNGMDWMILEHANPPGKMALMLHVASGSLNETESQRGLAHFIEHMLFNGTKSFPPGELIDYFESIGMEFGADVNAFTGFDQTAYMLFTPDTESEQIDRALLVLSEYAYEALFLEEEIDKERGIILAELTSHMGLDQRIRDELWPQLFAGSRLAERIPIGLESVIKQADRETFLSYYETWYRPDRITLMLVGDAGADRLLPLIEKRFGGYKPERPAGEKKGPELQPFTGQRAFIVTDPEVTGCTVEMYSLLPDRPVTTTRDLWRTDLVEHLGNWIMNRRYSERIQQGEAAFESAYTGVFHFFGEAMMMIGAAEGETDNLEKIVEEMIVELNRAKEHGFTERELNLARAELIADAERAVNTESTRRAESILMEMNQAVADGKPLLSAAQELQMLTELLPGIALDEINAAFTKNFRPETAAITLTLPEREGVTVPSAEELLAAVRAALARKTERLVEEKSAESLLTRLPEPGKAVESVLDADLQVTSAWLENGARVHHRFMDYKKDTLFVSVSLCGGQIEEQGKQLGITQAATLAFDQPNTARLSSTQISDLMTGKNVRVAAAPEGDAFTIQITGSPSDIETGLQLVHLLLTEGKIDETAFDRWKAETSRQLDYMQMVPEFRAYEGLFRLTTDNDERVAPITREQVNNQTLEGSQAWFDRLRREAPIEVAVVGELALEPAMDLVARYIGSLPARARANDKLDALRKVNTPKGPMTRRLAIETITPKGMVFYGFLGVDYSRLNDVRALNLASRILSSRSIERIREEKQLVYSISVANQVVRNLTDFALFFAGAPADPAHVDEVVAESEAIFKAFAETGPTDEELENAKKQVANDLDTQLREPGFWWQALSHATLRKEKLENYKGIAEAYQALTKAQVNEAFKKYYKPERIFTVIAEPAEPVEKVEKQAFGEPLEPLKNG